MYAYLKTISLITLCLGMIFSSQAYADHVVAGNKLSSLILDKTIRANHIDHGYAFSIYFAKDGKTAYRKQGGGITQTTYTISNDSYCLRWNHHDQCVQVIDNHNGTYSHLDNKHKRVVEWVKLENGKQFVTPATPRRTINPIAQACSSDSI